MSEILLAEDNPADVYLIREALREYSVCCTVRVASDGKDALQIISDKDSNEEPGRFDLIILDLNLPWHDGIEILQRIRQAAALAHVPVVILTSSDSTRDRQRATQIGVTRYLRKPHNLKEFLNLGAVFKDLLGQRNTSSEG